jgi:hypothetical protein
LLGSKWTRSLRHYAPVLVGIAIFAVVVSVTPTVVQSSGSSASQTGPSSSSMAGAPSYPPGYAPGDRGVAASGVQCAPGTRQVTWSKYAPYCQPVFRGNNGGATSPGVTGNTVTITLRYAIPPAEAQLLQSLLPGAIMTKPQAIALVNQYVDLFNRTFELWGRHVVLKEFDGQGSLLDEISGGGVAAAQADAATAKSKGAFADVSATSNTPPYDDALAAQHIISIGGSFFDVNHLKQQAPYQYAPGPDCQKTARSTAAVVAKSLNGLPAIYAGSPAMQRQTRKIALISPSNPIFVGCGQAVINDLNNTYHQKINTWVKYTLNLAGLQQAAVEASNSVSQLKSEGITTVLCGCDPITPTFLSSSANSQDYHPEWQSLAFGDAFSRLAQADQWKNSISGGLPILPTDQQEAVIAYRLATHNPTAVPPPAYQYLYEPLLLFFDALQAAGPDLTPQNFQRGMDSLPTSLPGGMFGVWSFGPGTIDPAGSFQLQRWNPYQVSPADGKLGTGMPCNGGTEYLYSNNAAALPAGRQLDCPAVP